MKRLLSLILLLGAVLSATAQMHIPKKENLVPFLFGRDSIKEYQIYIDEENKLQFICIIDSINLFKDEMYNKAVTYFTPPFKEEKSEMTVKDRTNYRIQGNRYLKNYSVTGYEFMNANIKTNCVFTYSTDMSYQVDIKRKRIRIKLTIERFYADVDQLPMSAVNLDYNKPIGESAPLEYLPINENPKPEERYKNSLNEGTNSAEEKSFKELCLICINTIEDLRKVLFGVVENKADTDDW